eukprot:scaffold127565_cov48-Attheya_sp.AAC.1
MAYDLARVSIVDSATVEMYRTAGLHSRTLRQGSHHTSHIFLVHTMLKTGFEEHIVGLCCH